MYRYRCCCFVSAVVVLVLVVVVSLSLPSACVFFVRGWSVVVGLVVVVVVVVVVDGFALDSKLSGVKSRLTSGDLYGGYEPKAHPWEVTFYF